MSSSQSDAAGTLKKGLGMAGDLFQIGVSRLSSKDGNKDIDIALVKATNHDEVPPKEKHVQTILRFVGAGQSGGNILHVLNFLSKRIETQKFWVVILKCLITIHRVLREGSQESVVMTLKHVKKTGPLFQLANYKDEAPNSWDFSSFVRVYSLYLDARIQNMVELGFDVEREDANGHSRTRYMKTDDLINKLPKLQTQMERAQACFPQGAATRATPTLMACMTVIKESFKLYRSVNDGIVNMLDKFFEVDKMNAQHLFAIYKTSLAHTEGLTAMYTRAKALDFANSMQFPQLDSPPTSLTQSMQEYIDGAPRRGTLPEASASASVKRQPSADLMSLADPAPVASAGTPQSGGFGFEDSFMGSQAAATATPSTVASGFGDSAFGASAATPSTGGAGSIGAAAAAPAGGTSSPLDLDNLYAAPQPQRTSIYGAPAPAANPALMGMGMPTQVSPMSAGQFPQMGGMMPPPMGFGQAPMGQQQPAMGFGQAPMGQQQPAMGFGQPAAPAQRMSFGQPAPMGQAQAPAAAGFGADPFGSNPFGGAPAPQPGAAPGSRANSVGGQPPPSNNPFASGSFI